jgi:carboxyl-terminal processing protease
MILDLRDNPGGLLPEAVKIADIFLSDDVIVSTRGRNKILDTFHAHKTAEDKTFPVVVLINGGSASAAEILAAALKDNKRAKLLGMNSFGKASVQTVVNLENGDAVKITIAYYYTPHNKLINGIGIKPDVVLDEKAYRKMKGIKDEIEENEATREDFDAFQKNEAVAELKKMVK